VVEFSASERKEFCQGGKNPYILRGAKVFKSVERTLHGKKKLRGKALNSNRRALRGKQSQEVIRSDLSY